MFRVWFLQKNLRKNAFRMWFYKEKKTREKTCLGCDFDRSPMVKNLFRVVLGNPVVEHVYSNIFDCPPPPLFVILKALLFRLTFYFPLDMFLHDKISTYHWHWLLERKKKKPDDPINNSLTSDYWYTSFSVLMQPSMGILTLPCPRLHLYSPFVIKFHGQDSPTIHLHW